MPKKTKRTTQVDPTKKLVKELTAKIQKQRELHTSTEVKDGDLFIPKPKFTAKNLTKYNYRQLVGLYEFMQENAEISCDEIRTLIHKNKAEFAYLAECDFAIPEFVEMLRAYGADYIVDILEGKTL